MTACTISEMRPAPVVTSSTRAWTRAPAASRPGDDPSERVARERRLDRSRCDTIPAARDERRGELAGVRDTSFGQEASPAPDARSLASSGSSRTGGVPACRATSAAELRDSAPHARPIVDHGTSAAVASVQRSRLSCRSAALRWTAAAGLFSSWASPPTRVPSAGQLLAFPEHRLGAREGDGSPCRSMSSGRRAERTPGR